MILSDNVKQRLIEIADELQPIEDALVWKWRRFLEDRQESRFAHDELVERCETANRSIKRHLPEIALLLNMTDIEIRALRPDAPKRLADPTRVWFHDSRPASFIRFAAQYGSIQEIDWRRSGWTGYPRLTEPTKVRATPMARSGAGPSVKLTKIKQGEHRERQ